MKFTFYKKIRKEIIWITHSIPQKIMEVAVIVGAAIYALTKIHTIVRCI